MIGTAAMPLPRQDPPAGPGDSLAVGASGVALLHLEYARTGGGWWDTAREWVAAMTRDPITAHPDEACLYRGAPAVAFTLHTARLPAFATALGTLDGHITTLTRDRLDRAHDRIDRHDLPALREFDLISGLTGIAAYLLHRHGEGLLLRDVLTYLVRLTHPLPTEDGEQVPGWWCGHGPSNQPAHAWAGGHGNVGIAHGIAGPLAILSTAMRRGVTVPGQPDAIARICDWLDQWRCGTGSRAWLPAMISRHELHTRTVRQPGPQRPS